MAALHLIGQSPFAGTALDACLARSNPGDAVLLIEDGVLALLHPALIDLAVPVDVFVLAEDLAARGLAAFGQRAEVIDVRGFVALATRCAPIITWV